MDLERAIEFILDQQARMAAAQAEMAVAQAEMAAAQTESAVAQKRADETHARTEVHLERMAKSDAEFHEKHQRDIDEMNKTLRRAIRLGVQEARAERKRRLKVAQETAELRTSH